MRQKKIKNREEGKTEKNNFTFWEKKKVSPNEPEGKVPQTP